jgi:site-specific recombinase XerD
MPQRDQSGTRAIRAFNIYEVQRMMGHRSITTTERYLHYYNWLLYL